MIPTTDRHPRLQTAILNPMQIQIIFETVSLAQRLDISIADAHINLLAVNYRKNYFADNGVLTSMQVGANPAAATMTIFTTISPGSPIPAPVDPSQGSQFEVDHLLEMQNFHGAFSVAQKP